MVFIISSRCVLCFTSDYTWKRWELSFELLEVLAKWVRICWFKMIFSEVSVFSCGHVYICVAIMMSWDELNFIYLFIYLSMNTYPVQFFLKGWLKYCPDDLSLTVVYFLNKIDDLNTLCSIIDIAKCYLALCIDIGRKTDRQIDRLIFRTVISISQTS